MLLVVSSLWTTQWQLASVSAMMLVFLREAFSLSLLSELFSTLANLQIYGPVSCWYLTTFGASILPMKRLQLRLQAGLTVDCFYFFNLGMWWSFKKSGSQLNQD